MTINQPFYQIHSAGKANAHGSPYPQKVSGLDKKSLPVPMTITHKSVVPAD